MFVVGNYVFGLLKQNLAVDQRVIMNRTSDEGLDNHMGTILGKSYSSAEMDVYIILLDEPYMGQKAIALTEACICPI